MNEKRLGVKEYRKKLLDFNKQKPTLLSESEFAQWLDDTAISRYQRADAVFTEVQNELKDVATRSGEKDAKELDLAIKKIDRAIALMSYGSYGWNKAATGRPRAILWPGRVSKK